jgi:DNA-binding LacI/PurR family transcriptional regulator
MRWLLDRHPEIDAVFAAADMMAAGALRVMRERGLVAPRDIAVIGFDDSVIARHTDPPLSSVYQPIEEMGQEMVRLLLAKIDGEGGDAGGLVLSTRLVLRGSA